MSDSLKIGLVGAGVFAGYHANKLSAHPHATFTGVFDLNVERAVDLAEEHKIDTLTLSQLLEISEAVVIACPAIHHGSTALQALQAGCHILVEKPLATSVEDAEAILRLSENKQLMVQVGHQERCVLRAIGLDAVGESPLHVKATRMTSYSPRGTDTSVTMDLMTHDIDICTMLFGGAPDRVEGATRREKSASSDETQAQLYYGDSMAELTASRLADAPERLMVITYPSGTVEIDFNAKTLTHNTPFDLDANFGLNPLAADSLGAATDIFIKAVLDGTSVLVSAQDGLTAVRVAAELDETL